MKYLFVLLFFIIFFLYLPLGVGGLTLGFYTHSPWCTHITYMFQHAGIIHLLVNSLSFVTMWIVMKRFYRKGYFFAVPFLLAFFTSFLPMCIFDKPTVGVSGVIYAMIGMVLPYYNFKKAYLFNISIAVSLIVSYYVHSSNFYLHLFCFIGGILFTVYYKYFIKTFGGGKPVN